MSIRCLVVDDEPLGRARITGLLRSVPEAEVIGECENGATAIDAIDALAPDVLFLDVQMPEVDGFGVLAAIDRATMPEVIFVTAHDRYALKAFEVHAQDYLLKPFDPDRLYAAFERAAQRVRSNRREPSATSVRQMVDEVMRSRTRRSRIPIRADGRVFFVEVADIDWIESADNYVRIHAKGESHLVRQTLQGMESSLSPDDFVRVHRGSIVNVARIREIQPWFNGEYVVLLQDGTRVRTSRGYRSRLEALMG